MFSFFTIGQKLSKVVNKTGRMKYLSLFQSSLLFQPGKLAIDSRSSFTVCSKISIWAAAWQPTKQLCAPSEDSDQPGHPHSLIRVFAVCFMGSWGPNDCLCGQQRLIRLGRCPGWFESSLCAQVILLVLSCASSFSVAITETLVRGCFVQLVISLLSFLLFQKTREQEILIEEELKRSVSYGQPIYTPCKLCLWGGILFSRCLSVRLSVRPSVRPWRFGFSLISWKGNDGNSSNFADTLISIRCTFIIEN